MSDLIGHIKAMRALAEAFAYEGNEPPRDEQASRVMMRISAAYSRAATSLEDQAKAGASGPTFDDRPQPRKKP